MKNLYLLYLFVLLRSFAYSQGHEMTVETIRQWPVIGRNQISPDGETIAYVVQSEGVSTLVIEDAHRSWLRKIPGADRPAISGDSRFVLFALARDSLGIFSVKDQTTRVLGGIASFELPTAGNAAWVACESVRGDSLLLLHLTVSTKQWYPGVRDFIFSLDGTRLLLHKNGQGRDSTESLSWVDLTSGTEKLVYRGDGPLEHFVFNGSGKCLAFYKGSGLHASLCYYVLGSDSVVTLAGPWPGSMPAGMILAAHRSGFPRFSADGRYLIFALDSGNAAPSASPVSVWNFADDFLPTQRARGGSSVRDLAPLAVIRTDGRTPCVLLTKAGDRRIEWPSESGADEALVCSFRGNIHESYWRSSSRLSYALVSFRNGSRRLVVDSLLPDIFLPTFSPAGRYISWYDPERGTYFAFNVLSGRITICTGDVPYPLCRDMNGESAVRQSFGVAGWTPGDSAMLLYDAFDLWLVDLSGRLRGQNVTQFYGRQHKIVLRYCGPTGEGDLLPVMHRGQTLLLRGFDLLSKGGSFFSFVLGSAIAPKELTKGPLLSLSDPKRARDVSRYILTLEGQRVYPNLYATDDFQHFLRLSDLAPEATMGWYSARLIRWKSAGRELQGLLYAPQNLDSSRCYPLIFSIYEKMSDDLNKYRMPGFSAGEINIPWFVNHGYLVCMPDIQYEPGHPGESAAKSVLSCARYLSGISWIDSTRMGLYGHSFGGYEVNYIVTQTNFFAAACSAAGISDLTNVTLGLRSGLGESAEYVSEQTQLRMRGTLWRFRTEYKNNSPVNFADKVTTPLLLMANEDDGQVPFSQGVEWFLALRRLKKPVWMLQYKGEGHTLTKVENKVDYTRRLMEFFDYYLKGGPEPIWMSPKP